VRALGTYWYFAELQKYAELNLLKNVGALQLYEVQLISYDNVVNTLPLVILLQSLT